MSENKYYVRGTISIEVYNSDFNVWIIPAPEFLVPDKENRRIVAFPSDTKQSSALIADLKEKAKRCHVPNKQLQEALFTLSVQRSQVELHIEQDEVNNDEWKIVGLKFPL